MYLISYWTSIMAMCTQKECQWVRIFPAHYSITVPWFSALLNSRSTKLTLPLRQPVIWRAPPPPQENIVKRDHPDEYSQFKASHFITLFLNIIRVLLRKHLAPFPKSVQSLHQSSLDKHSYFPQALRLIIRYTCETSRNSHLIHYACN